MVLKQKIFMAVILTVLLFLCGACTAVEPTQEDNLEDITWTLELYGEKNALKAVLAGTKITATFESAKGQLRGSAGCNQYFADYELSDGKLSVLNAANTERACLDPEGVMEQEQQYLSILRAAESYRIQHNKLLIDCGDSELIFITTEE